MPGSSWTVNDLNSQLLASFWFHIWTRVQKWKGFSEYLNSLPVWVWWGGGWVKWKPFLIWAQEDGWLEDNITRLILFITGLRLIHSKFFFFNKLYTAACSCCMQKIDWEDADWPRGKDLLPFDPQFTPQLWACLKDNSNGRRAGQEKKSSSVPLLHFFHSHCLFPHLGHLPKVPGFP